MPDLSQFHVNIYNTRTTCLCSDLAGETRYQATKQAEVHKADMDMVKWHSS